MRIQQRDQYVLQYMALITSLIAACILEGNPTWLGVVLMVVVPLVGLYYSYQLRRSYSAHRVLMNHILKIEQILYRLVIEEGVASGKDGLTQICNEFGIDPLYESFAQREQDATIQKKSSHTRQTAMEVFLGVVSLIAAVIGAILCFRCD